MHELSITQSVVEAVLDRIPDAMVTCVRLDIGALSGVVPDAVRFCFDLVAEGTNLQGARLEITQHAGRCRCRDCGKEFEPEDLIVLCPCGSADAAVIAGEQLQIASVEVA